MNKVMKIALLAASAMLAISFAIGCSTINNDGEKWCVTEIHGNNVNTKACYKIGPQSDLYKTETACRLAGVADPNTRVSDPPSKSECTFWDDGTKKSK